MRRPASGGERYAYLMTASGAAHILSPWHIQRAVVVADADASASAPARLLEWGDETLLTWAGHQLGWGAL